MTFLQPIVLYGLPLILVPVLIHLFNRLRHRPMPWAAMMFLRSATRKSTRYARLRQWLVLLLRVLAVLGLVVALSRPLAGGWMGWMASTAPDTILVLLDRSSSMEARDPGGAQSKRQQSLELISRAAKELEQHSRLVLLDSVTLEATEIAPVGSLLDHPRTRPSGTACDMPSLMQAALDWLSKSQPGAVELWIVSDLQMSNWQPENERWPAMVSSLAAMPQLARVRLLALNQEPSGNRSLAIGQALRRRLGPKESLELILEVTGMPAGVETVPLSLLVDGVPSQLNVKLESQSLRYQHRIPLEQGDRGGWGRVSLPADSNPQDNESWFVYGPRPQSLVAVKADDALTGRILELAAAPHPGDSNQATRVLLPNALENEDWDACALILWQGNPPTGEVEQRLKKSVESGAVLVRFPPGQPAAWEPGGWGETKEEPKEQPMRIGKWLDEDGPLANSEEGLSLPLDELSVWKRQAILGQHQVLAFFADGAPLFTRRALERGYLFYCATLPRPDWSDLQDGAVLVPMLDRLRALGSQRFSSGLTSACGRPLPPSAAGSWKSIEGGGGEDPFSQPGVYRSGDRWLAVNRPAAEDMPESLDVARVRALMPGLSLQTFEEKRSGLASTPSELWRWFLAIMLVCLLAEAILILPEVAVRPSAP